MFNHGHHWSAVLLPARLVDAFMGLAWLLIAVIDATQHGYHNLQSGFPESLTISGRRNER